MDNILQLAITLLNHFLTTGWADVRSAGLYNCKGIQGVLLRVNALTIHEETHGHMNLTYLHMWHVSHRPGQVFINISMISLTMLSNNLLLLLDRFIVLNN